FAEAVLIPGYIPNAGILPALSEWSWAWRYDAFPSIDPVKDATATEIELRTGMTTYADALADRGIDWREHFQQIGRERDMAKALGIEDLLWPDQAVAAAAPATTKPARQAERDTVLDDEEAAYAR
ncbi:MAG TPA: hypothetical protein VM597_04925, partial [Gemmataceae bacterium]|nr:hypothetical protein [Gemmataceae bacterium]